MKKIKLLSPILAMTTIGGCLPIVANCNKSQEVSFANDSWENIISYANQGIQALIDHYKPNGGTFVITPSDITEQQIAAKTRTIHINNYGDFKVRVVGECIDKIDDNTNAALTFEFAEIITKDCFHNDITISNPANYATSHIRAKLSEILNDFPSVLKDNIKTVKQTTAVIDDETNYESVVSDEQLFIMSLDEVYGVLAEREAAVIQENYCYQLYQYSTHQTTDAHKKPYFNKVTNQYEKCGYWLKTPIVLESASTNKQCYVIDEDGFFSNKKVDETVGISPCFCLGSEKNGIINIGASCPGFDVTSSQIVDVNQDIIIKIQPKTYKGKEVLKKPEESDEGKAQFKIFQETGRVYSDHFKYDASTGELKFIQNKIDKSMVFEMWDNQIALDHRTFVELCEEDENNNKNGTLVLNYFNAGDWLTVNLNNKTYQVNIIGINHDTIEANKKAAVTLEFYDGIEGYYWDDNGGRDYINSTINKNMNGSEMTSILNTMRLECPYLARSIKDVHKDVLVKKDSQWQVQDITTKLFILSDVEHAGFAYDKFTLGQIYDYYSINSEDPEKISRSSGDYWTRMPYVKEEQDLIWVFRCQHGKIFPEAYEPKSDYVYLAPAFCI